jgi:hypothetical protein
MKNFLVKIKLQLENGTESFSMSISFGRFAGGSDCSNTRSRSWDDAESTATIIDV